MYNQSQAEYLKMIKDRWFKLGISLSLSEKVKVESPFSAIYEYTTPELLNY